MRIRLTSVKRTKKKRDKKPQTPRFLDADVVTVGRGTDCDLHLSGLDVRYHHARFVARGGRVVVEQEDADTLVLERRNPDGQVESREISAGREVSAGDVLRIGRYEITVAVPGEDESLALEIEEVERPVSDRDEVEKRYERGIERGFLSRRPLSWAMVIVVAGLFWVAPMLLRSRSGGTPEAASPATSEVPAPASGAGGADLSRDRAARLLQGTWSVGPIASKHAGVSCEACHAQPWQRVGDESCAAMGCHADVGAHVDDHGSAWAAIAGDRELEPSTACTSCHLEHRGDAALIQIGDAYCVNCHGGQIEGKLGHPTFLAVDSFARHPEFRPSLVAWKPADASGSSLADVKHVCKDGSDGPSVGAGAGRAGGAPARADDQCEPARRRERIGSVELVDRVGGLIFPHDVHLAADLRGFEKTEVTQLACSSCHTPAPGGEIMTKVTFRKSCQPCHWHSLRFTEAAGALEVPHPASIADVRRAVRDFFLGGERHDPSLRESAPETLFRRPGAGGAEAPAAPAADVRQRAEQRAEAEAASLIDGQCASCHVLEGHGESLRVRPVFLIPLDAADRWFPYAKFDHEEHSGLHYPSPSSAPLDCESCHAARDPEQGGRAEIVLLPSIEECRKCHVGEAASPRQVVSNCLMCHEFHHKDYGSMIAEPGADAAIPRSEQKGDRAS